MIFFRGHAVEHEGINYLLPVEMESMKEEDYKDQAVSVDEIMNMLSKFTATVNVMLLDCCRENDLNETFKGGNGIDSAKGFGSNLRAKGKDSEFLIGLACDPGTVALANENAPNSHYTEALLSHQPVFVLGIQ